ncbi:MAG: hypothetical protein R3240_12105, partial [Gammaproteobacteria bacterium]|nr:hypothetical protein [Gammaproteobacteria bacterium]
MKFRKNILALSVTTALIGLTACGVTPQDEGTGEAAKKASGLAVDGYLAGATVYADTNENNKLDAWEPRALTDADGYFSYNPLANNGAGLNYCESDKNEDQLHCLSAPIGYDEVMLRISGGYDLTTMEKFSGTLSMKLNVNGNVITTPQMASPLTAILAHLTDEQKADLLTAEGLDASDVEQDFLDFTDTSDATVEAKRLSLMNLALKAHKVADMISGRINLKFDQDVLAGNAPTEVKGLFGNTTGVSNDGSDLVYQAIAAQITSGVGLTAVLGDVTLMSTIVDDSWDNFVAVVDEHNARLLA